MRVINIRSKDGANAFNKAADEHEVIIAGFFMKGCHHCDEFKPEWKKFTKSCKRDPKNALVATIPQELLGDIEGIDTDVPGFPTVRLINHGQSRDYNGPRESDALAQFLHQALSRRGGRRKKSRRRRRKTNSRRRRSRRKHRSKRKRRSRRMR